MSESSPAERRESLARALTAERAHAADLVKLTAWRAVEDAARAEPEEAFALFMEHIRALFADEPELAELLMTKALSLRNDDTELVTLLAAQYLRRGLNRQAVVVLEDLRRAGREGPQTDLLLGQAAWHAGDDEAARAAFFRIAAKPGAGDWASLKGAAAFFREQKDKHALRMLLGRMAEREPEDAELCLWLAEWLIEDMDPEQARVWLERALARAEPNSALYWQARRAQFSLLHPEDDERYRAVTAGIFSVAPGESKAELEALIARHPDFWEAHYFLGTCHRRLGAVRAAIECFEKTLSFFDYPNAWLELGALYGELGRPREALAASLKAGEHFEDGNHVAWCNVAAARLELKQFDEAAAALDKAAAIKPESRAIKGLRAELERRRSRRGLFRRLASLFGG